ncbi:MFS transporter [Providencia rettgeri]|uniref:MFS transporter n=1 Tax=Providencia TaxID=586 RepID=UPI001BD2D3DD|nr:MFS transporter [Providencia rettgeri]ELR5068675.1 MFS transporter [Providencia rettgeri]ELR5074709.1 MFS transporter [Providencia stuartii]ELR5220779.1 MFS transporter [Providencia rettgeri]MDX7321099.1 MFS transporter [Providencia rettgeri]
MISTHYLLLLSAVAVYLVGTAEFMLSAIISPLATVFNVRPEQITWLISAYALSYTLAAPIIGFLSDRIDRRKIVLIALLLLSLDSLAIIFSPNLLIALVLRGFGGLASAALVPVIFALIADAVSERKQAAAMGSIMMGMTVGIITGPIVAGILVQYFAWYASFVYTAVGCLLVFIIALFTLPHSQKTIGRKLSFKAIKHVGIVRFILAKGIWNGVSVCMFLLAGEILRQRSHLESVEVGSLMGLFGIGLLCGNGLVTKIEKLKISNNAKLVVIILIIMVTIILFLSGWLPLIGHGLCLAVLGGMLGLASPISTAMLARKSAENKGFILSISESVNNLVLLSALPIFSLFFSKGLMVTSVIIIIVLLSTAIYLVLPTREKKEAVD